MTVVDYTVADRYRVGYSGEDGHHVVAPDGRVVYVAGRDYAAARDAALFAEQCNIELQRGRPRV